MFVNSHQIVILLLLLAFFFIFQCWFPLNKQKHLAKLIKLLQNRYLTLFWPDANDVANYFQNQDTGNPLNHILQKHHIFCTFNVL